MILPAIQLAEPLRDQRCDGLARGVPRSVVAALAVVDPGCDDGQFEVPSAKSKSQSRSGAFVEHQILRRVAIDARHRHGIERIAKHRRFPLHDRLDAMRCRRVKNDVVNALVPVDDRRATLRRGGFGQLGMQPPCVAVSCIVL